MKRILLIIIALLSCKVQAIVPNTELYKVSESRIHELTIMISNLESELSQYSVNSASFINSNKLKNNYEKEMQLLIERVELYRRLEKNNLIMYSNGGEIVPEKTANKLNQQGPSAGTH